MSDAALISRNQLYELSESLECGPGNTDTPWGVPQVLSEAVLAGQGTELHGTIDSVSDAAFSLVSSQNSLCVKHVNTAITEERKYYPGLYVGRSLAPILVNYHHGSSEGDYKIFYQNTVEKTGSYLCLGAFVENIRGNRTFYNEDISWAGDPGRYWETVQNPLKIKRYWYLFGNNETPRQSSGQSVDGVILLTQKQGIPSSV